MDLLKVSNQIEIKIKTLELGRELLKDRGLAKAEALVKYEKALAVTIVKLKNGVEFDIDGEKVVNPPSTLVERIAKGICWRESLAKEQTEVEYKSAVVGIQSVEAELQGWQSIARHLEEV